MSTLKYMRSANFKLRDFNNLFVGLFLSFAFFMLSIFVVLMLDNKDYFAKSYILFGHFDSGLGLKAGTEVQVNGVRVGKVQDVRLDKDGSVLASFKVLNEFANHITSESVAYPTRDKNIISDRIIFISHGVGGRILTDSSEIQTETPKDIETLLTQTRELLDKVQFLVMAGDSLLQMASDTSSSIGALLNSNELYNNMMTQMNSFDGMTRRSNQLLDTLNQYVAPSFHKFDALQEQFLDIGNRGLQTMDHLDSLARVSLKLTEKVPVMLRGAQELLNSSETKLEKADHLMDEIASFWFMGEVYPDQSEIEILMEDLW